MITLTNTVKYAAQTDTTLSAVESTIDLLNGTAQAVNTYGTVVSGNFVPDPSAPGVNVTLSLVTGAIWVNGIPFTSGGSTVLISAADLAAIVSSFQSAQKSVDQALIDAGVFAGTAS